MSTARGLRWLWLGLGLAVLVPTVAHSDVLVRIDESALNGTFKGATDAAVMFESAGGLQQVAFAEIGWLLFSPRAGTQQPGKPAPAGGSGPCTLLRVDGTTLRGQFKGGTDAALLFESGGNIHQVALSSVRMVMNERPPVVPAVAPAAAAPPAVAATAPAAAAPASVIPIGTKLRVTLTRDVTTATHEAGALVEGVLAAPLTVGGTVVAPAGTKVFGKVLESRGGRALGELHISFRFTDLLINDRSVPIKTTEVGAEAKGGMARKVGAGALIGAAAGDAGDGAAIGAGLAVLTGGGRQIRIPRGTTAEVALTQDARLGG